MNYNLYPFVLLYIPFSIPFASCVLLSIPLTLTVQPFAIAPPAFEV